MIAVDTETTGLDFRHGARPFYVTICSDAAPDAPRFWEWDVDPLTRAPAIPEEDAEEVRQTILDEGREGVVLHNAKFDVLALETICPGLLDDWPWDATHDTTYLAHLLGSNQRKDLTALATTWLGLDIQPLEDAIDRAATEARRLCRTKDWKERRGEWRLAKEGLPEMPSAREKCHKMDMWLPRAIATAEGYAEDHPWWTVLQEYANPDSAVTLALYRVLRREAERRGLWRLYEANRGLIRVVCDMERRGIAMSGSRLTELTERFSAESATAGEGCIAVAASLDYDLALPKSGNNRSLSEFCFGRTSEETGTVEEWLRLPVVGLTDTGNPSLDKAALETYLTTLEDGPQLEFVRHLAGKRSRDTGLGYLESYQRFWLPLCQTDDGWFVIYPALNATGTDTLRFSSQRPNEQNISKKDHVNLRYAFGPGPGREWWCLDAQNIELRLPAYESGEADLIGLFERPDEPPYYGSNHLLNFSTVYPDIWAAELAEQFRNRDHVKSKYKASWYQHCKNGGFAKQYGAQREKTDATFRRAGAYDLIESRFRKLADLNARWVKFADRHGYVETMPDRTVDPRRGYPLLCQRGDYGRIKPTVPLNYHVQGSAMWWMRKAMLRCHTYLRDRFPQGWIALQVHDELVFDFPRAPGGAARERNRRHVAELKALMEQGGDDLGVPTPVNVEYCPHNWAETRAVSCL